MHIWLQECLMLHRIWTFCLLCLFCFVLSQRLPQQMDHYLSRSIFFPLVTMITTSLVYAWHELQLFWSCPLSEVFWNFLSVVNPWSSFSLYKIELYRYCKIPFLPRKENTKPFSFLCPNISTSALSGDNTGS